MQSLQQSVQAVVNEGRIGSPVFLRCLLQLPIESDEVVQSVGALATLANTWMPSPPEQLYVQSSTDSVQSTAMIQYEGGQTANLSINRIPAEQAGSVDLILVGNKGVIYHQTPVGRQYHKISKIEIDGDESLTDIIESAIKTGEPVKL